MPPCVKFVSAYRGGHPQSAGKIDLNRIPIMPQLEDIAQADYINHPYQRPAKLDKNS